MTVKQLLASLDSAELTEWMAFNNIEAIGEARADLRAGIVASTVANHGTRVIREPYRPRDFMPYVVQPGTSDEDAPILDTNPDRQSALILRGVFNRES